MISSYTGADLDSVAEAAAYAAHPTLRGELLSVLRAADAAFARHTSLGPYHVLDEGFGRRPQGVWVGGPVDSFKAWASCTLFRVLAQRAGDDELQRAAAAVLRHFRRGDDGSVIEYEAAGWGTAGYVEGEQQARRNVLVGEDPVTLQMLGASPRDA